MGGIFDVDLENGLVEEPEGKRVRFEKERKKGSKDGLQMRRRRKLGGTHSFSPCFSLGSQG